MNNGGMFFGDGFMWIFWLTILFGVVWIVKILIVSDYGSSDSFNNETPLEILEKRYANGEIDEEEFNYCRRELEK